MPRTACSSLNSICMMNGACGALIFATNPSRLASHALVEPVLHRRKSRPARNRGGEVHVLPFLVVPWIVLQARQAIKQIRNHPNQPFVTVRSFRPVEHGKYRWHRYGGNLLTVLDQVRVIGGFEIAGRIVFELIRVFDWQELETLGPLALQERHQRFGRDPKCRRDLIALAHFLHGYAVWNEG